MTIHTIIIANDIASLSIKYTSFHFLYKLLSKTQKDTTYAYSCKPVSYTHLIAVSADGELLEDAVIDMDARTVTVNGGIVADAQIVTEQFVPMGPAASQIAIKQTGTNGGGYLGVNSAHPLDTPNRCV